MSSSISIPSTSRQSKYLERSKRSSTHSTSSYSYSNSPQTPASTSSADASIQASPAMGEAPKGHNRRPSLLSSSFSQQEHTVINIGEPDAPRLISCVRSGQGFDWNPELFLSDHVDSDFECAERMPVHEIRLTEEEAKMLLPQ